MGPVKIPCRMDIKGLVQQGVLLLLHRTLRDPPLSVPSSSLILARAIIRNFIPMLQFKSE
jgi:hypothetical protein